MTDHVEAFSDVSDDALIDTYRHYKGAMQSVDEARTNLAGDVAVGEHAIYGLVKGEERLGEFREHIEQELRARNIDPDSIPVDPVR